MSHKNTLLILNPGFEEIEAVTPLDLLRRANISVTLASTSNHLLVTGKNNITLQADIPLEKVLHESFDAIILPGGPGVATLRKLPSLKPLLTQHHKNNKLIAAICAAPLVLLDADLLQNKQYTAHFSTKQELPNALDQSVVIDQNLITSQGAGTALDFGFAIINFLVGSSTTDSIKKSICL